MPPSGPPAPWRSEAAVLARFLLLSWALLVLNAGRLLLEERVQGAAAWAFGIPVLLTYAALYLLPAAAGAFVVHALLGNRPAAAALRACRVPPAWPARLAAVLLAAGVQLFVYADSVVYDMFGFHFNGFVWNLVTTPGGVESMGADPAMERTVALLGLCFVVAESALLLAALRWRPLLRLWEARAGWRSGLLAGAGFLLLAGGERLVYGLSDVYDNLPVMRAASVFPFYHPVRMRGFARQIGIDAAGRDESPSVRTGSGPLAYPRAPLAAPADAPRWNVLWLVAESLRADMLDPEIMPATSAFAARNLDFRDHFSGGNGTRMGMFSMFYGLSGPYWFTFLQERRSPVLVDFLIDRGYDLEAFTSAKFTYPEIDHTMFTRIPRDRLHEGDPKEPGWQNDRRNVTDLLASIDRVPAGTPFFRFMFFESPHARYHFPEECVIRRPYAESMDYAAIDPKRDIALIKARYVNSCRHLDTQFERVLRGIEERGLADRTLVIVTGDHGEEFMERGRWGHHSTFNRFQTRVPLVLHVPGEAPRRVDRMTSHLDLPATVLARLGVTTPPAEYGLGLDLLGDATRDHCIISGWDNLCHKDARGTLVCPMGRAGLVDTMFFDADDRELPVDAEEAAIRGSKDRVRTVLDGLARFRR